MTWAFSHAATPTATRSRRISFVVPDAIASLVVIALVVVTAARLDYPAPGAQPLLSIVVLWVSLWITMRAVGVYAGTRRSTGRAVLDLGRAAVIVICVILGVEALAGAWVTTRIPPATVALSLGLGIAVLMAMRAGADNWRRDDAMAAERVIVVGTGMVTQDIVTRLERSGHSLVLGLVDDDPTDRGVIGSIDQLPELCSRHGVSRIVVAFTQSHVEHLLRNLRELPESVAVDVVPRCFELVGAGARIEDFAGLSLVALPRRSEPAQRDRIKRVFDVAVASVVLVAVSPVLLVAALAVLITSGRPIMFRQERLGRHREPFRIMKLRTLKNTDEMESGTFEAHRGDAALFHSEMVAGRQTSLGKILRRTGIDELPQLFNVLAGQMSLVGPRPFVPEECWVVNGRSEQRFDVRPGLTGLWQVSGQHSLSLDELARLDAFYVDTWSFRSDLRILAKTPSRLWQGGGDGAAKLVLETSNR